MSTKFGALVLCCVFAASVTPACADDLVTRDSTQYEDARLGVVRDNRSGLDLLERGDDAYAARLISRLCALCHAWQAP